MSSQSIKPLIDNLGKQLGDRQFYTLRQLTSIGFFGSMPAARKAMQAGLLPFFKISPRRCVVSRHSLIDYLEKSYNQNNELRDGKS